MQGDGSLLELTTQLKCLGLDTKTPGVKAENRAKILRQRLLHYQNKTRRVPPPPKEKKTKAKIPPPPPKKKIIKAPPPLPAELSVESLDSREEKMEHVIASPKNDTPQVKLRSIFTPPKPRVSPVKKTPPPLPKPLTRGATIGKSISIEDVPAKPPMKRTKSLVNLSNETKEDSSVFRCEHCSKVFKKVAHLIVHSRTHKTLESKVEEKVEENDEEKEAGGTLWIEEFAKGLQEVAKPRPQLTRTSSMKEKKKYVPPPPANPPPKSVLMRRNSVPKDIQFAPSPVPRSHGVGQLEERILRIRTDIDAMEKRKLHSTRQRLEVKKDIDIQEAEWKLQQVIQELDRIMAHEGLYIDSTVGSVNGRMQRWNKEQLADKLNTMESDCQYRLRCAHAAVRKEEDNHKEYGLEAQEARRRELRQLERKYQQIIQHDTQKGPPRQPSISGASEADTIGKRALRFHVCERNPQLAEDNYRKALALDPEHATNLGNYALFLQHWGSREFGGYKTESKQKDKKDQVDTSGDLGVTIRSDKDYEADKYYRMAIRMDPTHTNNLANYASFLKNNMHEYDRAEQYYERAIRNGPSNASNIGNYANFLYKVRKDTLRGERLFKQALKLDPDHANNLCNYASLSKKVSKFEQAEDLYERALRLEPNNATILSNYANLLMKTVHPDDASVDALLRLGRARDLYNVALKSDPEHRMAKRNYMIFLRDFPNMRSEKNERGLGTRRPNARGRPCSPPPPSGVPPSRSPKRMRNRKRLTPSRSPRSPTPLLDKVIE
mmetsp:Transcript_9281/g.20188  ORF Transcript_9281/g.20188 Transcript_9281/m.20188 type:complete len:776 (-) Transcript_9281:1592-3919(-)|eukprot:CAMPEP_0203757658 /NCGR_PEP_ID=MMETSP0098-20131031/10619_1 /ASSEMBLY_ACC=CAM_ASM_000208 /TAXON_ID=96639 /ORGANISM=" , Strain NY0313808BC1" /LENGTH=775 /DNA_ID=CAMNT_0050649885 /DNA_START=2370 /DNA_END=4694 /DNA_ORIENTATION=-